MIGERFERLLVIAPAGRDAKRNALWHCSCSCGGETITAGYRLRRGETRSCGCLQRERVAARNLSHGQSGSRLYNIWLNMRARCGKPCHPQYRDYGERGISVCKQWGEFRAFHDWALSSGYAPHLTIDRIDNDGNYEPNNCRWATHLTQSRNKRPRIDQKLSDGDVAAIRNDTRSQSAIAAEFSVRQQHVSRIKSGQRRAFPTGERT